MKELSFSLVYIELDKTKTHPPKSPFILRTSQFSVRQSFRRAASHHTDLNGSHDSLINSIELAPLANNLLDVIWVLGSDTQILKAVLLNDNIIFKTDTADGPVSLKNLGIDIFSGLGVVEIGFDLEATEVDLMKRVSN